MIKRERYYDGHGNELKIDEVNSEMVKVSVNRNEIEVPLMKLYEMLNANGQIKGKHVKQYEIRKGI